MVSEHPVTILHRLLVHSANSGGAAVHVQSPIVSAIKASFESFVCFVHNLQEALREVVLERERFKNKIELYFKMKVWDPPSVIDDKPGFEDEESTDEE